MKKLLQSIIVLATVALTTGARAQTFTAGNLVIFRLGGDASQIACAGTATGCVLTNRGTRVWLDEYQILSDPSGTPTNVAFAASHLIRTNYYGANSPLIANGTAFGNGLITRSVDGRFILLAGFGATFGQFTNVSIASSPFADEAPRVVGLVSGNGDIDTSTTLTNMNSDNAESRSPASTDGTNIWLASDAGGAGGEQYMTRGDTDPIVL